MWESLLYFKYFTLLSSCLCGFWAVRCNACLCSLWVRCYFLLTSFKIIFLYVWFSQLVCDMPECSSPGLFFFIYPVLSCHLLVFSKLPGSVVWYLNLFWGHSQSFLLQIFFCSFLLFFPPASIPMHMLHLLQLFCIFLRYSIYFFQYFSFCFSVLKISIDTHP